MKFWNPEPLSLFSKISSILIVLVTLVGCSVFSYENQSVSEGRAEPIINRNGVISEYAPPLSMSEKTRESTIIVIGQVEKDSRIINSARDPNDINKPAVNILSLGQVYQLKIEKVLKGRGVGSTLFFVQHEGYLSKPQMSAEPTRKDIRLARQNGDYYPFVPGRRYLLFLRPLRGFEKEQYFTGSFNPWRFDATDENEVFSEGLGMGNTDPLPLTKIIAQIEAALTPTPEATAISPLPTPQPRNTFPPALP